MKKNLILLFAASVALFSCNSESGNASDESTETVEVIEEVEEIKILEPVTWDYSSEKLSDNEYKITFNANIDDHWYVYSNNIEGMGPIPTTIYYNDSSLISNFDEVVEDGEVVKEGYDELFDLDIKKFGKAATFSQVITTNGEGTISGYLEFMTCDSVQCLFPDPIEFTLETK